MGVVYLIMCKLTTLLHATLYVLFFVCTVGLRVYNLLMTYDDDDDDDETEKPIHHQRSKLANGNSTEFG